MRPSRSIAYALAALVPPLLIGGLRARQFLAREPRATPSAAPSGELLRPAHDPGKPTVAVVLAADISEITDVLGPYEVFARAGAFNVYAVAPRPGWTDLTGGLRLLPHYTLDELDQLLDGAVPAIVVAPNLPNVRRPENRPVVDWVRDRAARGALALSWCAGAAVLAEAGLLDGRTATSHWGDLARFERDYPGVEWVRGTRWIDHGDVVTSAGITSGIDATLRVLRRVVGDEVARRVATDMRYPSYRFAVDPAVAPYTPRLADGVLYLNAAFAPRQHLGLGLYPGIGELDVSAVYDAHAAAGIAQVRAVATAPGPVSTAFGLWLEPAIVPGRDPEALATLDRLLVPGEDGVRRAAELAAVVAAVRPDLTPEYLQAGSGRFGLEPVLEDLAASAGRLTATFAQRRLEYRSDTMRLEGAAFPFDALLGLLGLSGLSLAFAGLAGALRRRRRRAAPATPGARPAAPEVLARV